MKKFLPLFLAVLLLTGCAGGGGSSASVDEAAVLNVLSVLEQAYRTRDSGRLPRILGPVLDMQGVTMTREDFIWAFDEATSLVKTVHKYDFTDKSVLVKNNAATVEVWITADMTLVFAGRVSGQGPGRFELRKYADGWKITGLYLEVELMP